MNGPICFTALFAATVVLTACGGSNAVNPTAPNTQSTLALSSEALHVPSIYSVNFSNHKLEFWPLSPAGGNQPTVLSAKGGRTGMAGDGNKLLFGAVSSPALEIFNTTTQTVTTLADPFGSPGDVAIDRQENVYVLNNATPNNVAEFPASNPAHPVELSCNLINIGGAIAVDNEGDVFVVAFGPPPGYAALALEFANTGTGHAACRNLKLIGQADGPSGIAIDPKTDDLLIMDNPDECAGGIEGRVRIFPKPYQRTDFRILQMGANCSGELRLNADSTVIFAGDEDVSGSFTFILQRTYPGGRRLGTYWRGDATGFTTIPNTLPN
jgi:hypothetical protein